MASVSKDRPSRICLLLARFEVLGSVENGTHPSRVPARRLITALVVGGLRPSAMLGVLYLVGQEAGPPPEWASWRFTEWPNGAQDFACVAG